MAPWGSLPRCAQRPSQQEGTRGPDSKLPAEMAQTEHMEFLNDWEEGKKSKALRSQEQQCVGAGQEHEYLPWK